MNTIEKVFTGLLAFSVGGLLLLGMVANQVTADLYNMVSNICGMTVLLTNIFIIFYMLNKK